MLFKFHLVSQKACCSLFQQITDLEREVERWQNKHKAAEKETMHLAHRIENMRARTKNVRAHTPVPHESDVSKPAPEKRKKIS